jgi:hypothetical protein
MGYAECNMITNKQTNQIYVVAARIGASQFLLLDLSTDIVGLCWGWGCVLQAAQGCSIYLQSDHQLHATPQFSS